MTMSYQFGLIGRKLGHTFSPAHFNTKFRQMGLDAEYHAIELPSLDELRDLPKRYPNLKGLNVTIPYKKDVVLYLDGMDETARATGAVNTIEIRPAGDWIGYNTDVTGFQVGLKALLGDEACPPALILGTGGAAAAVAYALRSFCSQRDYRFVSRTPAGPDVIGYDDVTADLLAQYRLIVNATPTGMFPDVDAMPPFPVHLLTPRHFVFDLIYNPAQTLLLQAAATQGARTENGHRMLIAQAEAAWAIWQVHIPA